jgi:AcrR family transcriptional regulator
MAQARRKTRPQTTLSAERVRDEALRLIEADGLEEFSTRKLGRALGVEAMAIYWYYPSKDALLDAVVDKLVSKLVPPDPASTKDWIDALRKVSHDYRNLAHEYPQAFPLLATRRFATEGTYKFIESLFAIAQREGFDERTTARWYRLVSSYCSGVALNELAGIQQATAGPPPAEAKAAFPHLVASWQWLTTEHYDDVFSFGLEVLLDALAQAPRKAKARRSSK